VVAGAVALRRRGGCRAEAGGDDLEHRVDLGKSVVFLPSDDSSFVTGIELFADGGSRDLLIPS
jgi:hypothetical protein